MPLVPATCANCGASLTLDDATVGSSVECPYCHTALVFERTPDNTFVTNYKIAHADTVIVQDAKSVENRLANARTYLDVHKDYGMAEELYSELAHDASGEWQAWWGLLRASTKDLTEVPETSWKFEKDEKVARAALAVAPPDKRGAMEGAWVAFGHCHDELTSALQERSAAEEQLKALREQRDKAAKDVERTMDTAKVSYQNGCLWAFLALLAFSLLAGMAMGSLVLLLVIIGGVVAAWYFFFKNRADVKSSGVAALDQQVDAAQRRLAEAEKKVADCKTAKIAMFEY